MAATDTSIDVVTTDGTITGNLRHWSLTDPETPAFIFRSDDSANSRVAFTRHECFTLAARYAAMLRDTGIKPGEVVCNTLPNSPERLLTDLGVVLAGAAVFNGVVTLADGSTMLDCLRAANTKAIITDPNLPGNALIVLSGHLQRRPGQSGHCGHLVDCPEATELKQVLHVDCGKVGDSRPFLEDLKKREEEFVAKVTPSDLCYIMTTSGTSGFSKLVPRSHASYLALSYSFCASFRVTAQDVLYNDRALGWVGGAPFSYIVMGQTRVLADTSRHCDDALALTFRAIREEQCTAALFVPFTIDLVMTRSELWNDMKPRLRLLCTGGQPLRKRQTEVVGRLSDTFAIAYGSTEMGYIASLFLRNDQDVDSFENFDAGLPLDGVQVKLVDDDGHGVVEAGKSGEILVKGPAVFTSYLGIESGDAFTQDGWFRTADVAYMDKNRHLHVVCRKSKPVIWNSFVHHIRDSDNFQFATQNICSSKPVSEQQTSSLSLHESNAIMHGAFIVYPGWLEAQLVRCPGVQDIIIIPIPHSTIHQELCACVLPEPGSKVTTGKLREFGKSLFVVADTHEMSMVPRYYVMFDSFPSTPTGKVDRKAIQKSALRALGVKDVMYPATRHI